MELVVTVTGGPLYNLAGTDWEAVTGFSWNHHDGMFLFDGSDVAKRFARIPTSERRLASWTTGQIGAALTEAVEDCQ